MQPEFRIYRSLEEVGPEFGPCALTIGNFDGVHVGHREIFRRVVELSREQGWKPSALTFDPHPARVVAPERAPRLLSTPEQRSGWMREAGIVQVLILPFTIEFSHLSPEDFTEQVLFRHLGVRAAMVGPNFRFGRAKGGNAERLKQLGARHGFLTEIVSGIRWRGRAISSSEIRRLIGAGDVLTAGRFLGRVYTVEGEVVSGLGIGSKQTVPTLNLETAAEVLPANGVYVTRTRDLETGRRWPSVTNVGVRPTFSGDRLTVETHLLEPLQADPPRQAGVEFLRRLRAEKRFPDPNSLKAQILRDAARARAYLRRLEKWAGNAARSIPETGRGK